MRLVVAFLIAVGFLAGCSTVPISSDKVIDMSPGVAERAFADGKGAITVTRDKGLVGSACRYRLLIDGVELASIGPGERVTMPADPGKRIVSVQSRGICGGGVPYFPTTVEAGQISHLRYGFDNMNSLLEAAAPGFR